MSYESVDAPPSDEQHAASEQLSRQVVESAKAMYSLIRQRGSSQQADYCDPWESRYDVRVKGSDNKIAEHYKVGLAWRFEPEQPRTKLYTMTVQWFDKPDSKQSLHKIQYDLILTPESKQAFMTELDLKTELLKPEETPKELTRPMNEYDHQQLQQLASYISTNS